MEETKVATSNLTKATIVFLILFFPIGLFLMWFKTRWNIFVKLGLTAFFLLVIAGIAGNSKSSTQAENTVTPTLTLPATPTATPSPAKPLTLEERIKAKLKLGEDTPVTEVSTEPDTDPTTDKELPGRIAVLISYHMNGTYLDVSWTKKGSWSIDTGIIKDIFPLDESINTIVMIAQVPVTTAYGKDSSSMLDTVTIRKDTYAQINFAKFDSKNLPSIADHYVENHNIKD
jgi:hypothetical protein